MSGKTVGESPIVRPRFPSEPLARPAWESGCTSSGHRRRKVSYSNEVVRSKSEAEDPVDQLQSSVLDLAEQAHRLEPAEDLLDPLAFSLTDLVTGVPSGSAVDRARPVRVVLRDVGSDVHLSQQAHHLSSVVVLVCSEGDSSAAQPSLGLDELQGELPLRST